MSQNFNMADGTENGYHFRMNCGAAICRAKTVTTARIRNSMFKDFTDPVLIATTKNVKREKKYKPSVSECRL
jgi:hypothetical protein